MHLLSHRYAVAVFVLEHSKRLKNQCESLGGGALAFGLETGRRNMPSGTEDFFTSESVSEGHPDKVADYISDSVLDACLARDPSSRVACEVLCKDNRVVIAGEISCRETIDWVAVARQAVHEIGYTDSAEAFNASTIEILPWLTSQSSEIATAVTDSERAPLEQGAGDQGIIFGYATDETPELMPLPLVLAHRLTATLARHRKQELVSWLRPDAKAQVTVAYQSGKPVWVTDVVVSTQHSASVNQEQVQHHVRTRVLPEALREWHDPLSRLFINPSGSFIQGGPSADCGLTGRKIIVDSYGGAARHGGGAFSGKDPSKVDRSGAYFARYAARQLIMQGLARKAEIQVAYAIGVASPVAIRVETFGTGDPRNAKEFLSRNYDFRPAATIERLGLLRPIYRQTTHYGHFGRPGLTWEE